MKERLSYYMLFFIVCAITVFTIIIVRMESCSDPYAYVVPIPDQPQPSKQRIQKDGEQIIEDFISAVEYYRLAQQSDTMTWEKSHDPQNFYEPLAHRETLDEFYVASPLPTSTQIKVYVDTILYNNDDSLCFALLIVKTQYSDLKNFQYRSKDSPYNAYAIAGYREHKYSSYIQYPIVAFGVFGMDTYDDAKRVIRAQYFKQLSNASGSYSTVYEGVPFKYNVCDPDFFDKSPLFQKYDSTRYNFQMYRKDGKIQEYPIRKVSYFTGNHVSEKE